MFRHETPFASFSSQPGPSLQPLMWHTYHKFFQPDSLSEQTLWNILNATALSSSFVRETMQPPLCVIPRGAAGVLGALGCCYGFSESRLSPFRPDAEPSMLSLDAGWVDGWWGVSKEGSKVRRGSVFSRTCYLRSVQGVFESLARHQEWFFTTWILTFHDRHQTKTF